MARLIFSTNQIGNTDVKETLAEVVRLANDSKFITLTPYADDGSLVAQRVYNTELIVQIDVSPRDEKKTTGKIPEMIVHNI